MGRATFTATIERRGGRRFERGARALKTIMLREFKSELAPQLLRVGRQNAPYRSGKLQRTMRAKVSLRSGRAGIEVLSPVRSAEGYPYTGVTRFGHRSEFIVPRDKKALAFTVDGRRLVRRRVRGYHPHHDWAEDVHYAAGPHVELSARRIGRQLQMVVG